jgi:DNA invertase Pin-like site-specific DNA recombinase
MRAAILFEYENDEQREAQYNLVNKYIKSSKKEYEYESFDSTKMIKEIIQKSIAGYYDLIIVPSVFILKGNAILLLSIIDQLQASNSKFIAIKEGLLDDFYESKSALFAVSLLAKFDQENKVNAIKDGMRKSTRTIGRPLSSKQHEAKSLLLEGKTSYREIMRVTGLSKSSLNRLRERLGLKKDKKNPLS